MPFQFDGVFFERLGRRELFRELAGKREFQKLLK
jgi:hypothetical protein